MDLMSGIAAIGQAVKITKDLRDLDKDFGTASYKAKIVELTEALSNAKMTLVDAREVIYEKYQQIRKLQEEIKDLKSGESCPLCQTGRLKMTGSKPHNTLGRLGVQERTYSCQNTDCSYTEKRLHDPNGSI